MPNGAREHQAAIVAHGPFIPCVLLVFEEDLEGVVQVVVALLEAGELAAQHAAEHSWKAVE